jgi:hypothetical protein
MFDSENSLPEERVNHFPAAGKSECAGIATDAEVGTPSPYAATIQKRTGDNRDNGG